jgi:hypothetical protein
VSDPDPTPVRGDGAPRRRRALVAGGLAGLAVLVVVLVWFQPQALLFDTVVDEAFPTPAPEVGGEPPAAAAPDQDGAAGDVEDPPGADGPGPADAEPAGDEAAAPAEPVAVARGEFSSRGRYRVVGEATVYELEDGTRTLRFEGFESTNGPDLFVYLSAAPSAEDDAALGADAIDLGALTGNVGAQNYAIAADVDLDRYGTVVVWCRRFASGFGAADLVAS